MIGVFELVEELLRPKFSEDYVGVVEDNEDPHKVGRLRIRVPELYGTIAKEKLPWANPTMPFGGSGYGIFMIPKVGAKVRVKLFRGHPWFPIWTGVHWFEGEVPTEGQRTPPLNYVIKTPEGHTLELSDVDGAKYIKFTDVNGDYIKFDSENQDREGKVGHNWNVMVAGAVTIEADNKIYLKGGSESLAGVVTGMSVCHFTGRPHGDPSSDVECSKG